MHRVRVDIEHDPPVVVAEGEVDAFAAPDLEAAFAEAGRGNLLVDLERVSFMDSTALGLVARAVRLHGEAGGLVRVVLPRGSARRIFEITALDRALPIASSRTQGVVELRS